MVILSCCSSRYIFFERRIRENKAFRNNQIREGKITLEEALTLLGDENRPRYQNIRWHLILLAWISKVLFL
ncbi:MAG: hypothetical protein ACI8VC_001800 [Candidatus Endobugula sp.]|jgi:hypothetical protein